MLDYSILAFQHLRRMERENRSHDKIMAASVAYDLVHPTTRKGVAIKLKECVRLLQNDESGELDEPIEMLRNFFRTRKTIDGAWLRDLRSHIETVKMAAPDETDAVARLQSILAGMSKPRLA